MNGKSSISETKKNFKENNLLLEIISQLENAAFISAQLSLLEGLVQGRAAQETVQMAEEIMQRYYSPTVYRKLSLGINDSCNLRCAHCFYASTHAPRQGLKKKSSLSPEEWENLVDEALALGTQAIILEGKEPLLSPELTFALLAQLSDARKDHPDLQYDLLTNGTLLNKEYATQLARYQPSHVIVSIDGDEKYHDALRGSGSYTRAREGIRQASLAGVKNLAVTYVAMPATIHSLRKMICDFAPLGVQHFGIGLFFSTEYNRGISPRAGIIEQLCEEIESVARDKDAAKSFFSIHVSAKEHPAFVADLYKRGMITPDSVVIPKERNHRLLIPVLENPKTVLALEILPFAFYNKLRIEPDGAVGGDYRMVTDFISRKGVGNLRNVGNIQQLRTLAEAWKQASKEWAAEAIKYYISLNEAFAHNQNQERGGSIA